MAADVLHCGEEDERTTKRDIDTVGQYIALLQRLREIAHVDADWETCFISHSQGLHNMIAYSIDRFNKAKEKHMIKKHAKEYDQKSGGMLWACTVETLIHSLPLHLIGQQAPPRSAAAR
jgi:hypothetical protein